MAMPWNTEYMDCSKSVDMFFVKYAQLAAKPITWNINTKKPIVALVIFRYLVEASAVGFIKIHDINRWSKPKGTIFWNQSNLWNICVREQKIKTIDSIHSLKEELIHLSFFSSLTSSNLYVGRSTGYSSLRRSHFIDSVHIENEYFGLNKKFLF